MSDQTPVYWHLHGGKPERCLGGSQDENEQRRKAVAMGNVVVCMSMLAPAACAQQVTAQHRERAAVRERWS